MNVNLLPPRGDPVRGLLVNVFMNSVAISGVTALFPLYVLAHGGAASQVALFMAVPTVCNAASQYPIGWMLDRFGRRPIFLGAQALYVSAAAALLYGAWPLDLLLVVRSFQGVAVGAYFAAARTMVADASVPEVRGRRFAQMQTMMLGSMLIGPTVGGLAAAIRPDLLFVVALALTTPALVIARRQNEPDRTRGQELSVTLPKLSVSKGLIGTCAALAATGIFVGGFATIWPQYLGSRGYGAGIVGLTTSLAGVPPLLLNRKVGEIADHVNRRRFAAICLLVLAACLCLYPFLTALPPIIGALVLGDLAFCFVTPVLLAALSESAPPEWRGRVMSVGGLCDALGGAFGAGVVGTLYGADQRLAFWTPALSVALAAAVVTATLPRHAAPGRGIVAQRFLEAMSASFEARHVDVEYLRRLGSLVAPARESGADSPAVTLYLRALDSIVASEIDADPELLEKVADQRVALDLAWRLHYNARWPASAPGTLKF